MHDHPSGLVMMISMLITMMLMLFMHGHSSGLVTQFNPVSETHFSFSQVSNKPP